MAVNREGPEGSGNGAACESSGVHRKFKSNNPTSPVLSRTGRPRTLESTDVSVAIGCAGVTNRPAPRGPIPGPNADGTDALGVAPPRGGGGGGGGKTKASG